MYAYFYFWNENTIPEGNYNGITISNTDVVVGEGSGVDDTYRGKKYQKISFAGVARDANFEFTLSPIGSKTLIVRYMGSDPKKEQVFKKNSEESFVLNASGGLLKIDKILSTVGITFHEIEKEKLGLDISRNK